eukprot:10578800-Lingulodinium_polyedra.AAC.1
MSQRCSGPSSGQVESGMREAGQRLQAAFRNRGLTLSKKSVLVGNCFKLAQRVARALRAEGVPVQATRQAVDLGIGTGGGSTRAAACQNSRLVG